MVTTIPGGLICDGTAHAVALVAATTLLDVVKVVPSMVIKVGIFAVNVAGDGDIPVYMCENN